VLAPLHERELLYRLLTGEQGPRLRAIAAADSQSHRTARAIAWIKENFDQPLSIDALADTANMSKSSLHHHFKSLTAMSPLQYQKQIRLQEAASSCSSNRSTPPPWRAGWATRARPSSAANTAACSAPRPCGMWRGCAEGARAGRLAGARQPALIYRNACA
jgi:hypothetical protein